MNNQWDIRTAKTTDGADLARIYNHYVKTSISTFQIAESTARDFEDKIDTTLKDFPFLVAHQAGEVIGYAYASRWKEREAYDRSCEISIYLSHKQRAKGIGTRLYTELLLRLKALGYKCIIAGISLPNPESQGFHEHMGFEKCAHFKKVGYKFGLWIDVGYWQLFFD